ncbi:MAG: redoxin domain-containing protein [Thiobacillus sp.]|nr:redoxin domain-containing protein [Thiobacillus sp.]
MSAEITRPLPDTKAPALRLPTVGGSSFDLAAARPESFSMLVFYRGLHCPICKGYLNDLDGKFSDFEKAGVIPVAISSDPQDRAEKSKTDWGIKNLPIAYNFSVEDGRKWGLYISTAITEQEIPVFVEPGVFLIRPDQTLYAAAIQTMPFARPHFDEVLGAVRYVTKNRYPARGAA